MCQLITSVDSGEEDAPARAAIGLARVAFPSPLGGPRMKSACSSKGDDARQGAVGLRNIAVCCDEMHFLFVHRRKALQVRG